VKDICFVRMVKGAKFQTVDNTLVPRRATAGISQRYVARMILSSGPAMREAQRKISRRIMGLLKL
jgi:hypothetical protein